MEASNNVSVFHVDLTNSSYNGASYLGVIESIFHSLITFLETKSSIPQVIAAKKKYNRTSFVFI